MSNDLNTRVHSDSTIIDADARDDFAAAREAEMARDFAELGINNDAPFGDCPDCEEPLDFNGDCECCDCIQCEDDGQPSEWDEWQDVYGGDDYVYGSYGMEDDGGW